MSQKMLRVNLSELKTFRITCKRCKTGVVELPADQLNKALANGHCRLCGEQVIPTSPNQSDPLRQLMLALDNVKRHEQYLDVEVEFPSPD